jgi:hypothetical protein
MVNNIVSMFWLRAKKRIVFESEGSPCIVPLLVPG